MPNSNWSDRTARGYAILRAVMVLLFSAWLIAAPEKAMPGSSAEPARSLALVFASRSILLGIVFAVLAIRRRREALAWVLLADAALQVFDTCLAVAMHQGVLTFVPVALGALDLGAALVLLRASRASLTTSPA